MDALVVETHVSILFFVGDHVYKLKKPVVFDFVDQSTRAARSALCHREVELNRRLAPDVYEDVVAIVGSDGQPQDHLVVMKRLPEDRRLSSLVRAGDDRCVGAVDQIAAVLAEFHASARRSASIDSAASVDAVAALWSANFDQMQRFAGDLLDAADLERAMARSDAFLREQADLFAHRIDEGWICDGHGDLLTDDIYVLDDGPRIIDCLEFADHLRFGDVVADLAFLVMDLERLGAESLGQDLVAAYERHAATTIPTPLLHLWVAYRAQVRSMVACLRSEQEETSGPAVEQARALLALCLRHLDLLAPKVVLVGGLPGTGKSTLARGLGEALGCTVLRSDVVRKELVGIGASTPAPSAFAAGIYSSEQSERTYAELFDRARAELDRGRSVILDASFISGRARSDARRMAAECRVTTVELRCALPAAEAHRRIQARLVEGEDPSDADAIVAARMAELVDPWPESIPVSTAGPPAESVDAACAAIADAPR